MNLFSNQVVNCSNHGQLLYCSSEKTNLVTPQHVFILSVYLFTKLNKYLGSTILYTEENYVLLIKKIIQYIIFFTDTIELPWLIYIKINQHHNINYLTLTPSDWALLVHCNEKELFSNIYLLTLI